MSTTINEKTSFKVPKLTTGNRALYQIKLMACLAARNRADKALTEERPKMPSEEDLEMAHSAQAKKKLRDEAKEKIKKWSKSDRVAY